MLCSKQTKASVAKGVELRVLGPGPLFPVKYHMMHISYDFIASATTFPLCMVLDHLLPSASWHCWALWTGIVEGTDTGISLFLILQYFFLLILPGHDLLDI